MALLSVKDLLLRFGGPPLFAGAEFTLEPNERVCLMGRNGEGKSTLLKVLCGQVQPDSWNIVRAPRLRISMLPQDVPQDLQGTALDVVLDGLYKDAMHLGTGEATLSARMALSQVGIGELDECSTMSGGQRRRVLLARALAGDPDLLLLDEPTNHLDIPSIQWLESVLVRTNCSLLFVSHDRAFVRKIATRILELDRGRISSWECNYDTYVERRGSRLEAEDRANALFDKRLADEEVWIRKGIKARRTRNEGRVRALERMREDRRLRRERPGAVQMDISEAEKGGKIVMRVQGVGFAWGEQKIVQGLDLMVTRGDRIGIVGANGCGKTTLLRLLLGDLQPTEGTVQIGTGLMIAHFDQLRTQLRQDQTLIENIGDGRETITINGKSRHVMGYLGDFLFAPDRARGPISALSGGERNRLLLARIFSRPSNLLVLDEPTNDLDMETLDLLEDLLAEYTGTVLVVSHDREFLDRMATSTLVHVSEGQWEERLDGWASLLAKPKSLRNLEAQPKSNSATVSVASSAPASSVTRRKLSYKEQRELETLPARIEVLEAEIGAATYEMCRPEVASNHTKVLELQARMNAWQKELDVAYARWQELE